MGVLAGRRVHQELGEIREGNGKEQDHNMLCICMGLSKIGRKKKDK